VITLAGKGASYKIIAGNRFFVQNVFEELDSPGEWYLDRESATLYFWPPDDNLAQSEVVVPVLESAVHTTGSPSKNSYLRHVRVAGFHFQAYRSTAVNLQAAQHCTVAKSVFTNIGTLAVTIGSGSSNNRVVGNDITDTGLSGVTVRGGPGNLVSNNHIHHFSVILRNQSGISIRGRANVVSHNLIHDCPRSGITFSGADNLMEYNRIHHVNFEACDSCIIGMYCGGSYAKAKERMGNTVRFNFVSDSIGYCMRSPGHWVSPCHTYGIRMDDLTSGVTVYGNIMARTVSGAVQIHSGKQNVIENNILVDGLGSQICFSNSLAAFKKIESDMSDNRFVRNIVYYSDPKARLFAIGGWTEKMIAQSDYNVFYNPAKAFLISRLPGTRPDESFAKWRELGYEAHSIVADPLFVDPSKDDYRLRPDSPALKLGFKPIPVEKIGCMPGPDRASWPVDEQLDIWREELLLEPPLARPANEPAPAP